MSKLDYDIICEDADITPSRYGARAVCLQRLLRLGLPIPKALAIPAETVTAIAEGKNFNCRELLDFFGEEPFLSVRPSAENIDWGGPGSILNIGINGNNLGKIVKRVGQRAADILHLRSVISFSVDVMRLDAGAFVQCKSASEARQIYEAELDEPYPDDINVQLMEALRFQARAWNGRSARILRQAKGAPTDAGLGILLQAMVFGIGHEESGTGLIQLIDPKTGGIQINGRYLSQNQGLEALSGGAGETKDVLYLAKDARGMSLEEHRPEVFAGLLQYAKTCRAGFCEEMQVEFVIEDDILWIIDAVPAPRSARAIVRVAVDMANEKIITRDEAIMRIEPSVLSDLLHPQIAPQASVNVLAVGVAASPGAATGKIIFSATGAQALAAKGEACILVRTETTPEDIRGMRMAKGVITERGGLISHAAVIARGLGLPCVVGLSSLSIKMREKEIVFDDGRVLKEGDVISIDGTSGHVIEGAVKTVAPALDDAFSELMKWMGEVMDIQVRVNADTAPEVELGQLFGATGVGLCRTEHMFFEDIRLTAMREMIFADNDYDRDAALKRLLPMQRGDFVEIFEKMQGNPVCIRLFDPPLHEFLPSSPNGIRKLAEAMELSSNQVEAMIESLVEFNPMLGHRGVRLGVTQPEIYEMQSRALFEAVAELAQKGQTIEPEIMIPLVSARREVELVRATIDTIAARVRAETEIDFDYSVGVMVETPRAVFKAGEIAGLASFMSFGTNDLTQMTYALSRDDAGRFINEYVRQGVYEEDPFVKLDIDAVGELMKTGVERARTQKPNIIVSLCGEHGGDPTTIAFCRKIGLNYVSCSPYRVPAARLAAAQIVIGEKFADLHKKIKTPNTKKAVKKQK